MNTYKYFGKYIYLLNIETGRKYGMKYSKILCFLWVVNRSVICIVYPHTGQRKYPLCSLFPSPLPGTRLKNTDADKKMDEQIAHQSDGKFGGTHQFFSLPLCDKFTCLRFVKCKVLTFGNWGSPFTLRWWASGWRLSPRTPGATLSPWVLAFRLSKHLEKRALPLPSHQGTPRLRAGFASLLSSQVLQGLPHPQPRLIWSSCSKASPWGSSRRCQAGSTPRPLNLPFSLLAYLFL